LAKIRFKVIKYFATRQSINKIENQVRKTLGMKAYEESALPADLSEMLKNPSIQEELKSFEEAFDY